MTSKYTIWSAYGLHEKKSDIVLIMKRFTLNLLTLLIFNACAEPLADGPFENKWPNGNLMERGFYLKGKLDGKYEYFFINQKGLLFHRANMKEGACDGTSEFFYQNGNLKASEICIAGYIQDTSKFFYSDGSLNCLTDMSYSKPHGIQKCYFQNGELRFLGNLYEGIPEGLQEFFDPQGRIYLREVWENKKLVKVDHFNSEGELILNGTINLRHNNGRLYARAEIIDGHSQGMIFTYYEDGSIESDSYYINSLREGIFKRFHLNQRLMYTSQIKNGLEDGVVTQYAMDGTVLWQGKFKEGEIVTK
tara:strand:+ start:248 stop:1162 length:915 start_codon:yes stop_codon:yes gene_type:complete